MCDRYFGKAWNRWWLILFLALAVGGSVAGIASHRPNPPQVDLLGQPFQAGPLKGTIEKDYSQGRNFCFAVRLEDSGKLVEVRFTLPK